MSTKIGQDAEKQAAKYLQKQGFKIIDRNWRTRWCEIDIIASKNKIIYFTEVKYRSSANCGTGLDYITPKKMQQMAFAAEFWLSANKVDSECRLAAIELSDNPPRVINCEFDVQ
ncbi:MAG: YraN family protein [Candidatus Woesebacteria bacterium]|jgi:uncharacterized protein (TIGR00252 family)